ncbi:MAG: hypothetical protein R3D65_07285 [Zhengella sp.]|uniref:hypothetical protein n=1 Tax=Zhengella sp. TaxID=2282762 RepID=UPI001D62DA26|nr:hypothetical protein [Notoacmeibacter sp.]MCC0025840.1 hypothetical protein [Brucellaceae bacterium]
MLRFLNRLVALLCLAVACIMGILDLARSLAANRAVLTPLMHSWTETSPGTLAGLRETVLAHAPAGVWDPGIVTILNLPGFVVFAALALVFHALGYRPPRRVGGRFARDV